jgi:hypothetical protein
MHSSRRGRRPRWMPPVSAALIAASATACDPEVTTLPAAALQPDWSDGGPAASEQDEHTQNVMLFANVPRSTAVTQTYLAFAERHAYAGNFNGFRIIDVSSPAQPAVVADVLCNGAQGDVSVWGDLLFQSVATPQSSTDCHSTNVTAATPGMFAGIRIFDISDLRSPRQVHSVPTDCGSQTHTLVPDAENGRVFLYVSSYPLGGASLGPNCQRLEDGDGHSRISIVEVPLADPSGATVSHYHLDDGTQWATYLGAFTFRACRDVTVFLEIRRAAAACMNEAQMWDISDPANPEFLWRYDNPAVDPADLDLFGSASFSWDGSMVAFGDQSGGGGAARCVDPEDDQARIWFLDVGSGDELGSYKVPRSLPGVCAAFSVHFVPLPGGRNVLVASFLTGGISIVDVDALLSGATGEEAEVGYYKADGGNTWSSHWYNGFIYANDVSRGLDVMRLSGSETAGARRLARLNPQTQEERIP